MEAVKDVIKRNQNIPLGTFCTHPMAIVSLNTGNAKPVYKKQYPLPMALTHKVMGQVHKWDDAGITSPAPTDCPWNNPLCVSPKKDALENKTDDRVNFDARALNAILLQVDKHLMPTIQTAHDPIQGARYLSTMDLKWSFHQFRIRPEDRIKTVFTAPDGRQRVFNGSPFGLTPISHVVTRVMYAIFGQLTYAIVFVDDLLVFSASMEDHTQHIRTVINLLNRFNLKLRMDKCHFIYPEVLHLGFAVSADGIRPDPRKVAEIYPGHHRPLAKKFKAT